MKLECMYSNVLLFKELEFDIWEFIVEWTSLEATRAFARACLILDSYGVQVGAAQL